MSDDQSIESAENASDDDVEGHQIVRPRITEDDDVEGHQIVRPRITEDDDVEGHQIVRPRITDDPSAGQPGFVSGALGGEDQTVS